MRHEARGARRPVALSDFWWGTQGTWLELVNNIWQEIRRCGIALPLPRCLTALSTNCNAKRHLKFATSSHAFWLPSAACRPRPRQSFQLGWEIQFPKCCKCRRPLANANAVAADSVRLPAAVSTPVVLSLVPFVRCRLLQLVTAFVPATLSSDGLFAAWANFTAAGCIYQRRQVRLN